MAIRTVRFPMFPDMWFKSSFKTVLIKGLVCFCVAILSPLSLGDALTDSSMPTEFPERSLLLDITQAGERLIAVGERGHIVFSDDQAKSWTQAQVPVRVTLTSVFFVNEDMGWAVGHDGAVLRTKDAGQTWHKLLDGYEANELILEHAQRLYVQAQEKVDSASQEALEDAERHLENRYIQLQDAESFLEEGASRPFLDVWFNSETEGYIFGAFGMFLHTQDGGESWESVHERVDNPYWFHLNVAEKIGPSLFIVAEAGGIYRSDDDGQTWQKLESPYDGGFFGVTGDGKGQIIAFGLRGNAFVSQDNGRQWRALDTNSTNSFFASARLGDDSTLLLGNGGTVVQVNSRGEVQKTTSGAGQSPISSALWLDSGRLVTVGFGGVKAFSPQALLKGAEQ